jgi:glucose-1-phosphate thymidylyltransferase
MAKRIKGVVLAGGNGTRLRPLTSVTNKHLLPVYDKPMIFYPLETLKSLGCKDILIISGREHCGHILSLLGSGKDLGLRLSYEIQEEAGGIAHALGLAKNFIGTCNAAVCLGDNIFEGPLEKVDLVEGAKIYLKRVHDPERFGVAELDEKDECTVMSIEEKPNNPKSNYCVTGLYIYDNNVFKYISSLSPSERGELEITDVNNIYVKKGLMCCEKLKGFWSDAGTFESLLKASQLVKEKKLLEKIQPTSNQPQIGSDGEFNAKKIHSEK